MTLGAAHRSIKRLARRWHRIASNGNLLNRSTAAAVKHFARLSTVGPCRVLIKRFCYSHCKKYSAYAIYAIVQTDRSFFFSILSYAFSKLHAQRTHGQFPLKIDSRRHYNNFMGDLRNIRQTLLFFFFFYFCLNQI